MPKRIDGRLLRRRGPPLLACLLVALATVALAAGCGNSGKSDSGSSVSTSASARTTSQSDTSGSEEGFNRRVVPVRSVRQDRFAYARSRFIEMCSGCHTLADAGAHGRRYNLDHAGGLDESRIRYTIADGEPGMPAWRDVLSPREYEELVAYLVAVTRKTGGDDYWHDQLELRMHGGAWSRADTKRLEAYADRLVRARFRSQ